MNARSQNQMLRLEKLAELFPGYVSVVQRDYTASVPRLEVMVRWRKALEDGQRHRSLSASGLGMSASGITDVARPPGIDRK